MNNIIYLNRYINIALVVFGIILILVIVVLIKEFKALNSTINIVQNSSSSISEQIKIVKEKINKINQTKEQSLPIIKDIFYIFAILSITTKDLIRTKKAYRNITHSIKRGYDDATKMFHKKPNNDFIKNIINTIKK